MADRASVTVANVMGLMLVSFFCGVVLHSHTTSDDAPIADVGIGVPAARVAEPVARDVTAGPEGVELRQLGLRMVGLATVQVGETMVLLWVPGGGEMQVLGTFRLPAVPAEGGGP